MKIKILSVILLLFVVAFVGCKKKEEKFLSYQQENFEAKISFEIKSEKYTADLVKSAKDNYKITFQSPETIKGVSVEKKGEELHFSVGDVHIPIKEQSNITAKIHRLFELSEDDLFQTEATLYNGVKVNITNFATSYGKVTLYLSADKNIPIRIEADIDGCMVDLNISDFKIIESEPTNT